MSFSGKPIEWKLTDRFGSDISESDLYTPQYRRNCLTCGSRPICSGCSDCGRCGEENPPADRSQIEGAPLA